MLTRRRVRPFRADAGPGRRRASVAAAAEKLSDRFLQRLQAVESIIVFYDVGIGFTLIATGVMPC
jgi:hypothetical protein